MNEQDKESVTISLTRYDEFQIKSNKADRLESKQLDLERDILHLFNVLSDSFKKDFNRQDSPEDFLKENGIKFIFELNRLDFINR